MEQSIDNRDTDQHIDMLKGYMPRLEALQLMTEYSHLRGKHHVHSGKRCYIMDIKVVSVFDAHNEGRWTDCDRATNQWRCNLPAPKIADYVIMAYFIEQERVNGKWVGIGGNGKNIEVCFLYELLLRYDLDASLTEREFRKVIQIARSIMRNKSKLKIGMSKRTAQKMAQEFDYLTYYPLYRDIADEIEYHISQIVVVPHAVGLWSVGVDYYQVRKRDSNGIWEDIVARPVAPVRIGLSDFLQSYTCAI